MDARLADGLLLMLGSRSALCIPWSHHPFAGVEEALA